jgi:tRNA(fMet)-specific endonuclease VapC
MPPALLDTDILSELLKRRNPSVQQKALLYTAQHGQLAFSAITRYEVCRGYKAQKATTQFARFRTFCANSLILPVTDPIFDRAADYWANAYQTGQSRADTDLIIAATATESGRVLVTGNASHFSWIPGLVIEDWR